MGFNHGDQAKYSRKSAETYFPTSWLSDKSAYLVLCFIFSGLGLGAKRRAALWTSTAGWFALLNSTLQQVALPFCRVAFTFLVLNNPVNVLFPFGFGGFSLCVVYM